MKLLAALLLIGATSAPAFAGGPVTRGYRSNGGWAEEEKCFRKEYREEYVPGNSKRPGYVKTYRQRVEVPCERPQFVPQSTPHYHHEEEHPNMGNVDNNSCAEGTVACLLYTSPSPRDRQKSRMPSSA